MCKSSLYSQASLGGPFFVLCYSVLLLYTIPCDPTEKPAALFTQWQPFRHSRQRSHLKNFSFWVNTLFSLFRYMYLFQSLALLATVLLRYDILSMPHLKYGPKRSTTVRLLPPLICISKAILAASLHWRAWEISSCSLLNFCFCYLLYIQSFFCCSFKIHFNLNLVIDNLSMGGSTRSFLKDWALVCQYFCLSRYWLILITHV